MRIPPPLMALMVVPLIGLGAPAGDPARGREIALDPERGDCIICHQVHAGSPEQQGNLGPALPGVADRLSSRELYRRVEDARRSNPDTLMPPFGSTRDLYRVAPKYKGKPILTEREIRDVVSWLETLGRGGQ